MSFGCFVDIRQQCGRKVRMHYPLDAEHIALVRWIGINEETADNYQPPTVLGEIDGR